jgi:hypothetical protein
MMAGNNEEIRRVVGYLEALMADVEASVADLTGMLHRAGPAAEEEADQ